MNICFLSYRENNPYIGGIENVTYTLSKELTKRGHKIICLSQIHSKIEKTYSPACKELFLPNSKKIDAKENIHFLCTLIKKESIDIIINQYSTTLGFCKLCKEAQQECAGVKIITPLHLEPEQSIKGIRNNFFIKYKNGNNIKQWLIDLLLFLKFHLYTKRITEKEISRNLNYIMDTCDKCVILSNNVASDIRRITGKDYSEKVHTINNPIIYTNDKGCEKLKQIIYVGRLEYGLKRIDRVINIWKKIAKRNKDWALKIIGDGGCRDTLEENVKKENIERVYFEGYKDPKEYYKESSIICLTSSSESFAIVLAEAQTYGCIPIAYNSYSALSDIITDGYNGHTIPAFKEDVFIRKLEKLMNDEALRKEMSHNAREHSKRFDINIIANKWEELFLHLTRKN